MTESRIVVVWGLGGGLAGGEQREKESEMTKGTRKLWDEEYAHCLDHGDNIIVDMCQNINFTS